MMKIGQSVDIHQLVEGRPLILGGVEIPHEKGLLGHSDADVLVHAIMESIIGALGLGDLGKHFPDTDPQYKGISSMTLLAKTASLMEAAHYRIGNIDATILAERPKMAGHIGQMKKNIAACLKTEESRINIKATRGEKMGFVGHEEGMVALAVCLLEEV